MEKGKQVLFLFRRQGWGIDGGESRKQKDSRFDKRVFPFSKSLKVRFTGISGSMPNSVSRSPISGWRKSARATRWAIRTAHIRITRTAKADDLCSRKMVETQRFSN